MRNYIIGRDRCLVHTDSPLLEGWEPCKDIKVLQAFAGNTPKEIQEGIKWRGTKIPADLMNEVLGTIHEYPRMETAYCLYFSTTENKWAVKCPKQYGGGASVHYEDDGEGMPAGYSLVGSIHTHPEMGAFWSGVDHNANDKEYGLHFVFGLRGGLVQQHKCSVFTPTGCYDQQWEDVVEDGVDFTKIYEPNAEWKKVIDAQELKPTAFTGATSTYRPQPYTYTQQHAVFDTSYYDQFNKYTGSPSWKRPGRMSRILDRFGVDTKPRSEFAHNDSNDEKYEVLLREALEYFSSEGDAAFDVVQDILSDYGYPTYDPCSRKSIISALDIMLDDWDGVAGDGSDQELADVLIEHGWWDHEDPIDDKQYEYEPEDWEVVNC